MTARVHSLLSAARGIWLGQAREPSCRAYWTAEYLQLHGELDVDALRRSVDLTFREAETLHQRVFVEAGELHSLVDVPARVDLPYDSSSESEAHALLHADLPRAPDLRNDALYAVRLIRVTDALHLLYLRVHHIALDGSGYGLLYQRLFQCYALFRRGITPAFEARPLHELVNEEHEYRASTAFALDREHYATLLHGTTEPVTLRPLHPLGPRPRVLRSALAASEVEQGMLALRQLRLEPAALLLAALGCWLWEHTGETEHVVGLALAGRFSALAVKTPCMAMNIVPVRISVRTEATLAELARQIQEQLRAGRRHQRYRYEDLRSDRVGDVVRPFGVVLNYMPFAPPPAVDQLRVVRCPLAAGPVEDLALSIVTETAGWRCDVEAHPEAYDEVTLRRLQASWRARLSAVLAAAERPISELFEATRTASQLVSTSSIVPIDVLVRLEHYATVTPTALAIDSEHGPALDYATLLARVQLLAGALSGRGVAAHERVALLLRRSPNAIIAQLAVLWLGAAYVPVDPDGPKERLLRVLADARPVLLLADADDIEALGLGAWPWMRASEPGPELARAVTSVDQAAYLIFTSGSTGTPNGVVISRGALAHYTAAAIERYAFVAHDRVLQFSPLQFDASVEEIHLTLASGATLVLRSDAMLESFARFAAECERRGITVLDLPTAYWHELVEAPAQLVALNRVRLWIIGGEAAHAEKVLRHLQRFGERAKLINSYGPTETTVVCATAELRADDCGAPVAIGGPLGGVELLVLDSARRIVGQGLTGQLAVLGPTLATGYFDRAELTRARFVTVSTPSGPRRAYLTGDRVRVNERRQLVYLGRFDDELKLSGHRVQPLEIESALSEVAGVTECAVVVVRASAEVDRRPRLAAYYVVQAPLHSPDALAPDALAYSDGRPTPETLRAALRARVHAAAVPSHFQELPRLPRDANGKVDRNALRRRVPDEASGSSPPLSAWEQTVAAVFLEVLGHTIDSPDADFFALGGHSMAALQLASRLTRKAGFEVPLSQVFEHTTVRALAQVLAATPKSSANEARATDPLAPYVILREGTLATVFCVHPADGLSYCYWGLGPHWPGVRLVGLQPWALRHPEVNSPTLALERHAQLICQLAPRGPIHLLGYSSGGGIALELAVLLQAQGREVKTLAMLDSFPSDSWHGKPLPTLHDALVSMLDDLDASARDASGDLMSIESLYGRLQAPGSTLAAFDRPSLELMAQVALDGMLSYRTLRHSTWDGELFYFAATVTARASGAGQPPSWRAWLPYLTRSPRVIEMPTFHLGMTQPAILERVARALWASVQTSCA